MAVCLDGCVAAWLCGCYYVSQLTLGIYSFNTLQDDLFSMLCALTDGLDRSGHRNWLDGGTLLGALRHDGEFLPWHDTASVSIFDMDSTKLAGVVWPEGYALVPTADGVWKYVALSPRRT